MPVNMLRRRISRGWAVENQLVILFAKQIVWDF